MKDIITMILIICSMEGFSLAPADTTWNQTDEQGLKQGHWKKYYPNGKIMYQGFFRDNKPQGKMRRYYEDGILQAELEFQENAVVTYATMYFKNGQAGAVGKYVRQKRDSIWNFYSLNTGVISYKETYSLGEKHGLSTVYYPEGGVAERTLWENGRKQGKWEQFFEDTSLRLSSAYQMDQLDGRYQLYNREKTLKIDGLYKNGKMEGDWKFFDDEGKLRRVLQYEDGELLNKEEQEKWAKEFMEDVEKDLGKIPEPDFDNFFER